MGEIKHTKKNNKTEFGYQASDAYAEKYYKFPSFLIQNPNFSKMKDSSKIAYMLFKNEFRRSIRENWIDQEGIMYLEFTQAELMNKLNCYQGKVKSILNELEENNLIFIVQGVFNKKENKNEKNKYYLLKPDISVDDLFITNSIKSEKIGANTGYAKIAHRNEISLNTGNTGNIKNMSQDLSATTLDNTGYAKIAQDYYINNNLDTNRHLIDTEQDQKQDRILLDNFVEIMKDESIATFIPDRVLDLIKTFSDSYADAQQTVRTIHNAKNKAQKETGQVIAFEELTHYGVNADAGLYNTLLKAYQKQKTEQVENIQNLIFVYVKNWFIEKPIAQKQQIEQLQELPEVSLVDWTRS